MPNKCQVCDGPIVNGRCEYCGMPYRNDEVLYHLNESRADHYRHATPNARKIMTQQSVPVKDRKEALGRTSSREEIKAHQQKVREEAVKRMTAPNLKAAGKPGPAGKSRPQAKKTGSKKQSRVSLLAAIIIVAFGIFPGIFGWIMEQYDEARMVTWLESQEEITNGVLEWSVNDGVKEYYLKPEYGEVIAGADLEEGTYEAFIERGTATVIVRGSSNVRSYGLNAANSSKVLVLQEGDIIYVEESGALAEKVILSQLSS